MSPNKEALATAIDAQDEYRTYRRPYKNWTGWLMRPMGPLPTDAKTLHAEDNVLKLLPSYRWPALGLFAATIAVIIAVAYNVPWLAISPMDAIFSASEHLLGEGTVGRVVGWLVLIVLFVALSSFESGGNHSQRGKFLDRYALAEEEMFRMGSENWTTRQRVTSCFIFGLVHIPNIIFPAITIFMLMLVGGAFMWEYHRIYKRTSDYRIATLAATKLHATFNRWAVAWIGVLVTFLVLDGALSLGILS
jgi:hypothetical protein